MNNMVVIAVVRSLVQRGLEWLAATVIGMRIVNFIISLGIDVNPDTLVTPISMFLFGLIVYAVNKLGPHFDWINKIISIGLSRTAPAYVPNDSDAVISVAHARSVDTVHSMDVPPPGANE